MVFLLVTALVSGVIIFLGALALDWLVKKVAPRMKERPDVCPSGDDHALEMALMTAPEKRDPDLLAKLDAVAGRMLNG